MEGYFVITEKIAKKYGIQRKEMDQIWQWYGEEELLSILDSEFSRYYLNENAQKEMYEEALGIMNKGMMSMVDSDVFYILDNDAMRCLDDGFIKKWKQEPKTISFRDLNELLTSMEENFSIDLSYYRNQINEHHEYTIAKYGNDNWTIEDVCMCEVLIDKDILNLIIKEKEE